ncbi:MAG: exosortase-associated EpsI family protein [Planctomycetota bacterium]|nr:exosortase-associated EpsI family protein [Planctomycetota bacterium]
MTTRRTSTARSRGARPGRVGAAPLAAALGLLVLLGWSLFVAPRPRASEAYLAEIRTLVQDIPYAIGPMVGTDIEVVPAAARMLKPNAIFQRVYRDPLKGHSLSLVIVHCQDVRDLAGHYPPICYPSAGWRESAPRDVAPIAMEELQIPVTRYEFLRRQQHNEETVRVFSFFVKPSGERLVPDMGDVERSARMPEAASLGAAHIMIGIPADQDPQTTDRLVRDALREIRPLVRAIMRHDADGSHS